MLQARTKLEIDKGTIDRLQIPHIRLTGHLDIYTAQEFRRLMEEHLSAENLKHVVVDVQHLEYIDSSGIGVMFSAAVRLKKRHGAFWLLNPQEMVVMALQITRAAAHMNIYDSFDEVVEKITESEATPT